MRRFPEGLTIANGRFQLTTLLRGVYPEGLWLATDREHGADVWVTIRRARPTPERVNILSFSAHGIRPPLYVGAPDPYDDGDHQVQREYYVVVDEVPDGAPLAEVGRLDGREGAQLGIDLCDVITTWAAGCSGHVFRGLRPETIFVAGVAPARRFTSATPRPYFLLGNEASNGGYPAPSFDPPNEAWHPAPHDALFSVALLVWFAVTGVHPYVIPRTDTEENQWHDKRVPFDGPAGLGHLLERALVADPASRISVDDFRAGLKRLLASDDSLFGHAGEQEGQG